MWIVKESGRGAAIVPRTTYAFISRPPFMENFKCINTFTQTIKSNRERQEVYASLQQKI
jgi:hypothetical protein